MAKKAILLEGLAHLAVPHIQFLNEAKRIQTQNELMAPMPRIQESNTCAQLPTSALLPQ
jgi:hypothetical protein